MKLFTSSSVIVLSILGISAPAFGFSISISPPRTLNLNGQDIETGVFTVNSAFSFVNDGTSNLGDIITGTSIGGLPTSINAIIGETGRSNFLFDAPDNSQALRITGNFNASTPDLPPALFDIFIDAEGSNTISPSDNYIYYLPEETDTGAYQITELNSTVGLSDNQDTFCGNLISPTSPPTVTDDGNGGVTVSSCGDTAPAFIPQQHGTSQPVPVPEPSMILSLSILTFLATSKKSQKKALPRKV